MELLASLLRLQQSGTLCDVRLKSVDRSCVLVHSSVLAAASSALCVKLSKKKFGTHTIKTELSEGCLTQLVKFLYTGRGERTAEVQDAAKELGIDVGGLPVCASQGVQTEDLKTDSTGSNNHFPGVKKEDLSDIEDTDIGLERNELDFSDTKTEAVPLSPEHSRFEDRVMAEINRLTASMTCVEHSGNQGMKNGNNLNYSSVAAPSQPENSDCNDEVKVESTHSVVSFPSSLQHVDHDPAPDAYVNHQIKRLFKYECTVCGRKFKGPGLLEKHKTKHILKIFACLECGKEFGMRHHMLRHAQKVHFGGEKPPENFCKVSPRICDEPQPFHKVSQYQPPKGKFPCSICGKAFGSASHLTQHMNTHNPSFKPYKCDICGMSFRKPKALLKHMKRGHRNKEVREKPYRCEPCDLTFKFLHKLLDHERLHSGEKPFVCEVCGECFSSKERLRRHRRSHSEDKHQKCSYCDRCYKYRSALIVHERNHTGERPFICGHCGQGFMDRGTMLKHEGVHKGIKPFSCNECGNKFSAKFYLEKHMRTHTGERPFSCEVCGLRFGQKSTLLKHSWTHTGERRYRCDPCHKAYSSYSAYKFHMNSHNKLKFQNKLINQNIKADIKSIPLVISLPDSEDICLSQI